MTRPRIRFFSASAQTRTRPNGDSPSVKFLASILKYNGAGGPAADVGQLLDNLPIAKSSRPSDAYDKDGSISFNNSLGISEDVCELYAGAFFRLNPVLGKYETKDKPAASAVDPSIQQEKALKGRIDQTGQYNKFEQSVFRLDRLLNRRTNKLRSMPTASESGILLQSPITSASSATSKSTSIVDQERVAAEHEGWLGSLLRTPEPLTAGLRPLESGRSYDTRKEREVTEELWRMRVEALKGIKVSDVLRRAMVVTGEEARVVEAEVRGESQPKTAWIRSPSLTKEEGDSCKATEEVLVPSTYNRNTPLLLLDGDAVSLLDDPALLTLVYLARATPFTETSLVSSSSSPPSSYPQAMTRSALEKEYTSFQRDRVMKLRDGRKEELVRRFDTRLVPGMSGRDIWNNLDVARKGRTRLQKVMQMESLEQQEGIITGDTTSPAQTLTTQPTPSVDWTPEEDSMLMGFVEAFTRRKHLVTRAFLDYAQQYTLPISTARTLHEHEGTARESAVEMGRVYCWA